MGLMVVIAVEGTTFDGSGEPAKAPALMYVLAGEVVPRIPKLEPGQSARCARGRGLPAAGQSAWRRIATRQQSLF